MSKAKIKKLVKDMLVESHKQAIRDIDKVLNSGCIDIDNWDEHGAKMVLPKTILVAILENEAQQHTARGSYEKTQKKEVENIRYFI